MNYEQINELTVETSILQLITRLYPDIVLNIPEDEAVAYVLDVDNVDLYDRIVVHRTLIKPPMTLLEAELVEYKNELTVAHDAQLLAEQEAEAIRQAELQAEQDRLDRIEANRVRFDSITTEELSYYIIKNSIKIKSIPDYNRGIHAMIQNEQADEQLALIESDVNELRARIESEEQAKLVASYTQNIIDRCDNAMKFIVSKNLELYKSGVLTDQGLDDLEVAFSSIMSALTNKRPKKAIELLQNIDISGTVYTNEDVSGLISVLS